MFGQQIQNPFASAAKWIFFGFFGVVLMGFLLGANIKDATWINPGIATAQVERIRMETAHQDSMNQLQEQLATAQTAADIQKIQNLMKLENAQFAHDIETLNQDLAHRDIAFKMRMNVLSFMSYLLIAAGTILATIWAGKKILTTAQKFAVQVEVQAIANPPSGTHPLSAPEKTPTDPWASPAYRRLKIQAARQEERNQRKNAISPEIKIYKDPARISKEEYKRRPLAGD